MKTKNRFFGIYQLVLISTLLGDYLMRSSAMRCTNYRDTIAKDGPTEYSRVQHFESTLDPNPLLLESSSTLQLSFDFKWSVLRGLYQWTVNGKEDNFYAYFKRQRSSSNHIVNCYQSADSRKTDDVQVRNLTTCFVPTSPDQQRGVIKCNKTDRLDTLPGCANESCSLIHFANVKKIPAPAQIVWISVFSNGSTTNENSQHLKIYYKNSTLNVTSCSIESCKAPTDTVTEGNESKMVVGVVVGMVLAVITAVAVIGGIVWWKRRANAKSACKSSTSSLAPTIRTHTMEVEVLRSSVVTSGTAAGLPGAAYSTLDSNSSVAEDIPGLGYSLPNFHSNPVVKGKSERNPQEDAVNAERNSKEVVAAMSTLNNKADLDHGRVKQALDYDANLQEGQDYTRMGNNVKNVQNPYNTLLQPKEDPKSRAPISVPVATTLPDSLQSSSYSLARSVLEDVSGQPFDIIGLKSPPIQAVDTSTDNETNQYDWIVHDKDDWSNMNAKDDYDYLSTGDILSNNAGAPSTPKQVDNTANPYKLAKPSNNPYFELENASESQDFAKGEDE